jgi:hypothetical protein
MTWSIHSLPSRTNKPPPLASCCHSFIHSFPSSLASTHYHSRCITHLCGSFGYCSATHSHGYVIVADERAVGVCDCSDNHHRLLVAIVIDIRYPKPSQHQNTLLGATATNTSSTAAIGLSRRQRQSDCSTRNTRANLQGHFASQRTRCKVSSVCTIHYQSSLCMDEDLAEPGRYVVSTNHTYLPPDLHT